MLLERGFEAHFIDFAHCENIHSGVPRGAHIVHTHHARANTDDVEGFGGRGMARAADDVARENLETVIAKLPALHTPTVSNQLDDDWVAVEIITDEEIVRDLIPQLKRVGAEGIIEYPLNKVVY